MYMDGKKLYATKKQHSWLIKMTCLFSNDIRMFFGLSKCKTLHLEKGKIV